jgi:hypothetical protein
VLGKSDVDQEGTFMGIAIEVSTRVQTPEKRSGVWYFIVTHANNERLQEPKLFQVKGTWPEDVKAKATTIAKKRGCIDEVDSIFLYHYDPD